jgi:putative ABC transport system permease protein
MLKNYLTIAFRNLAREKGYAFINIAGLAVGLAACLLIALFVQHELSFDRFHVNADRIHRLVLVSNGHRTLMVPEIVAPELEESLPEVEQAVRISHAPYNLPVKAGTNEDYEDGVMWAEQGFFDIFSFDPLAGELDQALAEPGSIVITRYVAEKYFGSTDVVGQGLEIPSWQQVFTIQAVIEDLPANSSIHFNMVAYRQERSRNWATVAGEAFVLVREGTSTQKFRSILSEHVQRDEMASMLGYDIDIQPLTEFHLLQDLNASAGISGPRVYSVIFSGAAILILLIACINYMNLATARSTRRAREVGIRKVVGARRSQLAWQFLAESLITSSLAVALGLILLIVLLPIFGSTVGIDLSLGSITGAGWLVLIVGLILLVGMLSGSYPAVLLSSCQPVSVLKGSPTGSRRTVGARKALVVFQFTASVGLIIGSLIVWQQMEYVRSERLDRNDEQIVTIQDLAYKVAVPEYETFRAELISKPGIAQVTFGDVPNGGFGYPRLDSTGAVLRPAEVNVDYDYLETLGLKILAGQSFSSLRDGPVQNPIIINETAARWLDVEDPVGKQIQSLNGTVVGIVQDYHVLSMHEPVYPLILRLFDDEYRRSSFIPNTYIIRLQPEQVSVGLVSITETWEDHFPNYPMSWQFLNDQLDETYRAELRMGRLFGWFSGFAILIACLGLYGLAAYSAEQRTKEIGIRKVMGATVPNLVALLSKDFIRLVLIAFVIAVPAATLAISRWLDDFAYRIEIGPGNFLIAGGLALITTLVTVSYQAVKAALANPIQSLRYE